MAARQVPIVVRASFAGGPWQPAAGLGPVQTRAAATEHFVLTHGGGAIAPQVQGLRGLPPRMGQHVLPDMQLGVHHGQMMPMLHHHHYVGTPQPAIPYMPHAAIASPLHARHVLSLQAAAMQHQVQPAALLSKEADAMGALGRVTHGVHASPMQPPPGVLAPLHLAGAPSADDDDGAGGKGKTGISKKAWTPEEDQILTRIVEQHGAQKWSTVSSFLPGRVGKQCRERWFNHLSADVKKGQWTEAEDQAIMEMVARYGTHWSQIVKFMPGRTDNAIKNRYNSAIRKQNRLAARAAGLAAQPRKEDDDGGAGSAADGAADAGGGESDGGVDGGVDGGADGDADLAPPVDGADGADGGVGAKPQQSKKTTTVTGGAGARADGGSERATNAAASAVDDGGGVGAQGPAAKKAAKRKRARAAAADGGADAGADGGADGGADADAGAAEGGGSARFQNLSSRLAAHPTDCAERRELIKLFMRELRDEGSRANGEHGADAPAASPAPAGDALDTHLSNAWDAAMRDGCPSARKEEAPHASATFDFSLVLPAEVPPPCARTGLRIEAPSVGQSIVGGDGGGGDGAHGGLPSLPRAGGQSRAPALVVNLQLDGGHAARAPDTATAAKEILSNFALESACGEQGGAAGGSCARAGQLGLSGAPGAPGAHRPPTGKQRAPPAGSAAEGGSCDAAGGGGGGGDWMATYTGFNKQAREGAGVGGVTGLSPALTPSNLSDFLIDAF